MISLKNNKVGITAIVIAAMFLMSTLIPAQGTITFGAWRDIDPAHYSGDVSGTLRGIYVRNGGTGSIGAGEAWAVGGSTAPIIAYYDGFSWRIKPIVIAGAFYNSVHFCTTPGAPSVGLCSPNGDGTDGWIVGALGGAAVSVYVTNPTSLTRISNGLLTAKNLTSVFEVCHSPPSGSGCPGVLVDPKAVAVGSNATAGAIYYFNGNPVGGSWAEQKITGATTDRYNSVYMFIGPSGNLEGFAVGDGGVVARLNGGTWTSSALGGGASDLRSVFVDNNNPIDAWAVGRLGQLWHFQSGFWVGPTTPVGTSLDLTGVFLTSTTQGWAIGQNSTVLHTTDGFTWSGIDSPLKTGSGKGLTLFGLSFPASDNGWAVGTQGIIIHTSNSNCGSIVPAPCWGGTTSISQSTQFNKVFELNSNDAWAGGNFDDASNAPSLIHWDGTKWHRAQIYPMTVNNPYIWGIYMLSSSEGWALGGNQGNTTAEALKWNGNTWTGQPINQNGLEPRSVFMINSGDGWAVGTKGSNWRFQSGAWGNSIASCPLALIAGGKDLNSVFINNPGSNVASAGWAVGKSGTICVLQIVGGTPTWINGPVLTAVDLYDVFFIDSTHGWIVGASGTIFTTADGGGSWSGGGVAGAPPGTILRSVSVDVFGSGPGNGDGWVVGDDGAGNTVMGHWEGSGWNVILPPSFSTAPSIRLNSVFLKGPEDGFAVGTHFDGNPKSLAAIFHLDPLHPNQIATTTTPTTSTTSSSSTTSVASSTTSVASSTSSTSTSATSSTSTTSSMSSTSSASSTSISSSSTSSITATSGTFTVTVTSSSSLTAPLVVPPIPGFPWESIIAGIVIGLCVLVITRRRRNSAKA